MDRARNPETKRRSSSRATQRDGRLSLSDDRKCWWGKNLWRSLKLSTQPKHGVAHRVTTPQNSTLMFVWTSHRRDVRKLLIPRSSLSHLKV